MRVLDEIEEKIESLESGLCAVKSWQVTLSKGSSSQALTQKAADDRSVSKATPQQHLQQGRQQHRHRQQPPPPTTPGGATMTLFVVTYDSMGNIIARQ